MEGSGAVQQPAIHIDAIASSDAVIKSTTHQDKITKQVGIIAFEMAGAAVWDEVPCIVVKGVRDYADCPKHKDWQNFGAATAAAVTKAIIQHCTPTDQNNSL